MDDGGVLFFDFGGAGKVSKKERNATKSKSKK